MAKRTRSRMDLRNQYEAAERDAERRRQQGGAEEEAPEAADEADGDEGAAVKKKKPKKAAEPKPKRPRAAKVVRQKVVWVVFDNSNKRIQAFDYARRQDADDLAAKLQADKKSTFFVQPVKEPIEE
jgi:hypothetical protein